MFNKSRFYFYGWRKVVVKLKVVEMVESSL